MVLEAENLGISDAVLEIIVQSCNNIAFQISVFLFCFLFSIAGANPTYKALTGPM